MAKFTEQDYLTCRKEGLTQRQMAERFAISEAYVSKVKRRCEGAVEKATPSVIQTEVLSRQYDALSKLSLLADKAAALADLCEKALAGDWEAKGRLQQLVGRKGNGLQAYVAILAEMRKQLELDNTIKRTKFDIERCMRFQEETLQAIQEESPEMAQRIVRRLMAADATLNALDFGLKTSD
ncbi:MAG: hypothetical protein AAGU21_00955 [Solidesulfovibrio sp.]|uniref:hypothetical protein n=1 Tax=Solidesulfovibrio sp. TaxID=2910990 RepID=UPI002B21BF8F|nr:hypothetical protein [Solidesulfovibrio sp.]MEA4857889.1 hypothetical protein [Solidesulfovibrio sp.]